MTVMDVMHMEHTEAWKVEDDLRTVFQWRPEPKKSSLARTVQ